MTPMRIIGCVCGKCRSGACLTWSSRAPTAMTSVDALVRAVGGKHCSRSLQKDLDIQPERPLLRISEIEAHHIVEGELASPVDLPETSDSGLHFQQAPAVPDVVGLELIWDRGSWPDQ